MTWQSLQLRLRSQPALALLFPDSNRLRDLAFLVAGNLLKLGLGLGTSLLIFRTLGPGDAGKLTLTLGVIGLLSIIAEFGLRDAAVNYIARFLPTATEQAAAVARTFLVSKLVLSALASTVGIFSAGWIAAMFYPGIQVADFLQLGAYSLFMDGLLAFATVVLEAQRRFAAISLLGVVQALLRAALVLALFLTYQVNLYTLLVLESVVPLAVFVYALRLLPRSYFALRAPLLEHFGLLWHFTKWIALAALASTVFLKLDVLMLGYYRTTAEVGLYAAAFALVSKLDVVKSAVLTTAFPDACRRTDKRDLNLYVAQSLRMTLLVSAACLPLFVLGGALVEWLYGSAYRSAVVAFYPLLIAFLIGLNAEPVAYVLYPLNQPRWIAASDLVQLAFCVLVNVALIPSLGIAGAAWGVLFTRLVAAAITFALVRRFLWKEQPA